MNETPIIEVTKEGSKLLLDRTARRICHLLVKPDGGSGLTHLCKLYDVVNVNELIRYPTKTHHVTFCTRCLKTLRRRFTLLSSEGSYAKEFASYRAVREILLGPADKTVQRLTGFGIRSHHAGEPGWVAIKAEDLENLISRVRG